MPDHRPPDYELDETFEIDSVELFKAVFEETRMQIAHLLTERAATISEIADTLSKPKGTIGHHIQVMEEAGLIRVVRTKKVRAIEAKYYGRVARTYLLTSRVSDVDVGISPDFFLTSAAVDFANASIDHDREMPMMSSLRYARIPEDRAQEWVARLGEVTQEFVMNERGGETTYGMLVAFYPTDRPHLPDKEESG
jgi:DNA-binding transcriptional ArsR family regulator